MSIIPTVNVTARFSDPEGRPLRGAVVSMRLTTTERCQGYVVPADVRAVTDGTGTAVLAVWPNALGTESSEYLVTVTFPENCAAQGGTPGRVSPRSIRAYAVVPDADCLLHDIMELPPYDRRGAGQIIPSEVAAYADAASHHADAAGSAADEARAVETRLLAAAKATEAAKDAAIQAGTSAAGAATRAETAVKDFDAAALAAREEAVTLIKDVAGQRVADAQACISQAESVALDALERRTGEALTEATQTLSDARAEAVAAIDNAGRRALSDIGAAGAEEVRKLRDEAALYDEDFQILTERALAAAKKAGCSAASAANSASKACECAARAETAAQGLERGRDEALDAATRAETAAECAKADAQRAEAAADSAQKNADHAAGSALAAQKAAQAADASAQDANLAAEQAVAAQQATAADKAFVEKVADDVETAIRDVAVDMLTPQVVTDAVDKATKAASDAADAANAFTELATAEADRAEAAGDRAEESGKRAETAAERAEGFAGKLQDSHTVQASVAGIAGQFYTLSDRVTKLELLHAAGDTAWTWPGGGNAIGPEGISLGKGVTLSAVTLVEDGAVSPSNAALTARIEDYTS